MAKETPEPIHISPTLKDFIVFMKGKLKRQNRKFYSVPKTLLYYLTDSDKFCIDYAVYCEDNNMENDLTPKLEKMKKIIKFDGGIT